MRRNGYFVSSGFVGYVGKEKILFANESDYQEYLREAESDDDVMEETAS